DGAVEMLFQQTAGQALVNRRIIYDKHRGHGNVPLLVSGFPRFLRSQTLFGNAGLETLFRVWALTRNRVSQPHVPKQEFGNELLRGAGSSSILYLSWCGSSLSLPRGSGGCQRARPAASSKLRANIDPRVAGGEPPGAV